MDEKERAGEGGGIVGKKMKKKKKRRIEAKGDRKGRERELSKDEGDKI